MGDKLSFTVEDAQVLTDNPKSKFALLSLDFFASGKNLHNMYVSEETLLRTSDTIKNVPLVWKYDKAMDDAYTHDKGEIPCGFVPESSTVKSRKLPDGRTMLSVTAYIWKRYTGDLLNIFKRDKGTKPVSVEMSVFKTQELPNTLLELQDYTYECVTILGTYVTPAIPMANASVVTFSQLEEEYNRDLHEEFYYNEVDMTIPEIVRVNAETGLKLRKSSISDGTSSDVAFARYLTKEQVISPDFLTAMDKHFTAIENKKVKLSEDSIEFLLWGGKEAKQWVEELSVKMAEKDKIVTFPYKSMKDANPALKGITPPVSLAQANVIAKQADAVGESDKVNGWAVAIASFKKTHKVEDGKWVEKGKAEMDADFSNNTEGLNPDKEENKVEDDKKLMAAGEAEETPAEEKKETPAEEKKEEEAGTEKKFAFPKNFNADKAKGWLLSKYAAPDDEGEEGDEEDEDVEMAKAELDKGVDFADPSVVMGGMFAQMCKMEAKMAKMEADMAKMAEEKKALGDFKASAEESQKAFEVGKTMQELCAVVAIPEDTRKEMVAAAENYSLDKIEEWKMFCKAKSFEFAVKTNNKPETTKIGLPFTEVNNTASKDLWA